MIILGTNSVKDTGYDVDNSVRVQTGAYMSGSNGTATNNDKYTISFWVKRGKLTGTTQFIIEGFSGALNDTGFGCIRFRNTDVLDIQGYNATYARTNRIFRDISAWYHIVVAYDTTLGTADDRVKLYINGVEETSLSVKDNPTQNQNTGLNNNSAAINFFRRRIQSSNDLHGNGYFSEFCMIDGQALDATSFGEFDEDSGIWKPIDVSGLTFGNNGFYLDFKNSSSLGADVSGNTNNFTTASLATTDQSTDTCTNNSCVINSLDNYFYASTLSEGNLKQTCNSGNYSFNTSTFGLSQGKWYVEVKVSGSNMRNAIGITDKVSTGTTNALETLPNGWSYQQGEVYNNSSVVANLGTFSSGNIVGIYLDLDNNKLYFAINGTIQNSGTGLSITAPASTTNGNYFFAFGDNASSNSDVNEVNFGSPSFAISSGNTDVNGYGNFEYNPSSGTFDGASKDFYALNTKNLAEYG